VTGAESDLVATRLDDWNKVERGILEPMLRFLGVGPGVTVLDAGCGAGGPALLMAALGAEVWGLERDPERLSEARARLAGTPFQARVRFARGDLLEPPFEGARFDLVWCSYTLHHVADKPAAVRALARLLRPGGRLAIREGGLPPQLLPFDLGFGEPGLQDRLRVADNRWFVAMTRRTLPDEKPYPYGWTRLLGGEGLADVTARTFVLDLLPPFDAAQARFVRRLLSRTLGRDGGEHGPLLSDGDREALRALLDERGPHFVLKRDDLHLRYGLSLYCGRKP